MATVLAFIRAIPILDSWFQELVSLYVTSQKKETLSEIVDAAALASRAQTEEDRYAASQKWREALSRPRTL